MAKDSPKTKPKTETPFQRFERLVRKLVAVPKGGTDAVKGKQQRSRRDPHRYCLHEPSDLIPHGHRLTLIVGLP